MVRELEGLYYKRLEEKVRNEPTTTHYKMTLNIPAGFSLVLASTLLINVETQQWFRDLRKSQNSCHILRKTLYKSIKIPTLGSGIIVGGSMMHMGARFLKEILDKSMY